MDRSLLQAEASSRTQDSVVLDPALPSPKEVDDFDIDAAIHSHSNRSFNRKKAITIAIAVCIWALA